MIKRTLYFSNPAYLGRTNDQMVIRLPEVEKNMEIPDKFKKDAIATIPVEDIGVVIIDHKQVTITQGLLAALLENNAAVIVCNDLHHPEGLMLPLDVHHVQQERFKAQIESTVPLKKQLWQQTVEAKIGNQAVMLKKAGHDPGRLAAFSKSVKSGDPDNLEGTAAHFYWSTLFKDHFGFTRDRNGVPPNNLLNYGYAILRAVTARSLVGSGLLPTLGIHHSNKYNAYCLADDIMEPYRPFVDDIVFRISSAGADCSELTIEIKKQLLSICTTDIHFEDEHSPLMVGMQRTTASLAQCFEKERRTITYPELK
jgi:CRISPR-associated protein Cas1